MDRQGNLYREALVNRPQMSLTVLGDLPGPAPLRCPLSPPAHPYPKSKERVVCAGLSAYFSFYKFNGRKILYQMRITRDERMRLPFESPKPVTDFADTPIGFIPRPWPVHLLSPFLSLNPWQPPPPALTPPPAPTNMQPEIGFLPPK